MAVGFKSSNISRKVAKLAASTHPSRWLRILLGRAIKQLSIQLRQNCGVILLDVLRLRALLDGLSQVANSIKTRSQGCSVVQLEKAVANSLKKSRA